MNRAVFVAVALVVLANTLVDGVSFSRLNSRAFLSGFSTQQELDKSLIECHKNNLWIIDIIKKEISKRVNPIQESQVAEFNGHRIQSVKDELLSQMERLLAKLLVE